MAETKADYAEKPLPVISNRVADDWSLLIASARGGDESALARILQQVNEYLLAIAGDQLGTKLQAKFGPSDIVQRSMLEVSQEFDTFRGGSEAELKSWLKRIVLHNLTDEARRYTHTKSRESSRELTDGENSLHQDLTCPNSKTASWMVSRNEQNINLLRAISRLPSRQRLVVESRHRWAKSYQQIGEELNVTENAARNLWTRAMENLRNMLSDNDGQLRRQSSATKPK